MTSLKFVSSTIMKKYCVYKIYPTQPLRNSWNTQQNPTQLSPTQPNLMRDKLYRVELQRSEPRRHTVEMFVSAIHTFVHLWLLHLMWPLTLKTILAIPTHVLNICGKFYQNPSIE